MPRSTTEPDVAPAKPRQRKARPKPVCGQSMPNAHGQPSGQVLCTLKAGHDLPHVSATDYVRHTWQPSAPAAAPAPKPKPAPPKRPAKRRRPRHRRRRGGWPKPIGAALMPIISLGVAGATVHVLALVLPALA